MGKFKAGDKVKLTKTALRADVSHGVVVVDYYDNEFVVDMQNHRICVFRNECDWELDTEPEPKPMFGTIKPVPEFKPGDRVVRCMFPKSKPMLGNGTVVCGSIKGTYVVIDDEGNANSILDQWVLAKKDDPKISLKSGPIEGRMVTSKVLEVDGVIIWNGQFDEYRVKLNDGNVACLTNLFELVGDDPVEPKSDDRIDALEKRVAELEKKANKSEEAIIREFAKWMKKEGWVYIDNDTEKYIKEVLNK